MSGRVRQKQKKEKSRRKSIPEDSKDEENVKIRKNQIITVAVLQKSQCWLKGLEEGKARKLFCCCCISPALKETGVKLGVGDFGGVFLTRYA